MYVDWGDHCDEDFGQGYNQLRRLGTVKGAVRRPDMARVEACAVVAPIHKLLRAAIDDDQIFARRPVDNTVESCVVVAPLQQLPRADLEDEKVSDSAPSFKRFITFYITNFPPQASSFFLRKGFEVCGILEDVFVANNRNKNGAVYGFVRFAKVRDVDKLLKALNNVCFSQYCVHTKLARFDKTERVRESERDGGKVVGKRGRGLGFEGEKKREEEGKVMGEGVKVKGAKRKEGAVKEVGVGTVVVRVGESKMGKEGVVVREGRLIVLYPL